MAKLKELIEGLEKLKKLDELRGWKNEFEGDKIRVLRACNEEVGDFALTLAPEPLPDHIKEIIVNALDAEIKKLEEE